MIATLEQVLSADKVAALRASLEQARFVDGRATAGVGAQGAKKNLEVGTAPELEAMSGEVTAALTRHEGFRLVAMPIRLTPAIFSKYEPGMYYGDHVDGAVMQGNGLVRTDLAFTLFLSEPDEYEGGDLVIQSDVKPERIRLKAGSAVLYPGNTLHRVEAVRGGTRLAAIGWVQSMVRDPARRDILVDLARLARWARETAPGTAEATVPSKLYANLVRMWAEL